MKSNSGFSDGRQALSWSRLCFNLISKSPLLCSLKVFASWIRSTRSNSDVEFVLSQSCQNLQVFFSMTTRLNSPGCSLFAGESAQNNFFAKQGRIIELPFTFRCGVWWPFDPLRCLSTWICGYVRSMDGFGTSPFALSIERVGSAEIWT